MAKKTQAPSRSLDHDASLSEARIVLGELYCLKAKVETNLGLIVQAQAGLQQTGQTISRLASRLRDLLEAQEHGSPSPQGKGAVPVGRDNVDGRRSRVSRSRASKRRVGSRKWVPCKAAWEDYRPWRDDPWKD